MGEALALSVIRRHAQRLRRRAYRVTIDLDPTDDPTYGAQQLTFFNGHYDNWCYLPLLAFVTFDDEAEQYLCAAVLRLGFPGARFLVRLDGGFATPALLAFLDAQSRLDYVVAMAENAVLTRAA